MKNPMMFFKIGGRLIFGFSVLIAALLGTGGLNYLNYKSIWNFQDIVEGKLKSVENFSEVERRIKELETLSLRLAIPVFHQMVALQQYLISEDDEEQRTMFADFGKYRDELKNLNSKISELATSEDEKSIVNKIKLAQDSINDAALNAITIKDDEGVYGVETKKEMKKIRESVQKLLVVIKDYEIRVIKIREGINIEQKSAVYEVTKATVESKNAIAIGISRNFIIIASCILFGILIATLLYFSLTIPLSLIINRLKDIASEEGDLTKRMHITSNDEIGNLSEWFNVFIGKTHETVKNISFSSLKLVDISEGITNAIMEASSTANEAFKGAERLSSECLIANKSISEINRSIKNVSEISFRANEKSVKVRSQALEGEKAIKSIITAMNKISESSKKIVLIVDGMEEIAIQTSLLSLNASIEAAKAGDQGRGFAIVAEEIRKLSEKSTDIFKEIKDLIKESTERVNEGSVIAEEGGKDLTLIIVGVKETTTLIEEISKDTKKQTLSSNQVVESIKELTNISSLNSSAMENLKNITDELAKETSALSDMTDIQQEAVNQFKV